MTTLRLSDNIEIVPRDRDFAVYNTLFGNLCLMDKEGIDYLRSFSRPKELAPAHVASVRVYQEELQNRFFLVADDMNERRYLEIAEHFRRQHVEDGYLVKLLQLVLTNDCNLGCKYCFIDTVLTEHANATLKPRKMSAALAIAAVLNTISILNKNGNNELSIEFFGGEPLLSWSVIEKVLDYFGNGEAHGVKIHYSVVTNAVSVTPTIAKKLAACGVTTVVSFDSPRNVNRLTKKGNSVDDVIMRGLDILSQQEVRLTFNTVMVSSNIAHYDFRGLLDVAKKHNVEMIGLILDLAHGPYNDAAGMEKIYDNIIATVIAARDFAIPVTGYWHQIFEQIIGMRPHYIQKGFKTCVAEGCKLSVEPDGAVANCKCGAVPMGSIFNLQEVFKTPSYRSYALKACKTTDICTGCRIEGFCSGLCMGTLENTFNDVTASVTGACDFYRAITKTLIQTIPAEQVAILPFPSGMR